jgi:hypothetical protein
MRDLDRNAMRPEGMRNPRYLRISDDESLGLRGQLGENPSQPMTRVSSVF